MFVSNFGCAHFSWFSYIHALPIFRQVVNMPCHVDYVMCCCIVSLKTLCYGVMSEEYTVEINLASICFQLSCDTFHVWYISFTSWKNSGWVWFPFQLVSTISTNLVSLISNWSLCQKWESFPFQASIGKESYKKTVTVHV